jgi:hypothetical protein
MFGAKPQAVGTPLAMQTTCGLGATAKNRRSILPELSARNDWQCSTFAITIYRNIRRNGTIRHSLKRIARGNTLS